MIEDDFLLATAKLHLCTKQQAGIIMSRCARILAKMGATEEECVNTVRQAHHYQRIRSETPV